MITKIEQRLENRTKKNNPALVILSLLIITFNSNIIFASDNNNVVAVVNNEIITKKDLGDFVGFMQMQLSNQHPPEIVEQKINEMLPDLINRLIEDRLIIQAAYKEGIVIPESKIEEKINLLKKKYAAETGFLEEITAQGLSLADIELKIKEQFLMFEIIEQKIKRKIVILPKEVTLYYSEHKEVFDIPELRHVRFLETKDTEQIRQLEDASNEYKDLDTMSWACSLEITDLGWVEKKQLKEEIAEVVFGLEKDRFSPLIISEGKGYIFDVQDIKPPQAKNLSEVQKDINVFIFEEKMEKAMLEWLGELRSEAYIDIREEYTLNDEELDINESD